MAGPGRPHLCPPSTEAEAELAAPRSPSSAASRSQRAPLTDLNFRGRLCPSPHAASSRQSPPQTCGQGWQRRRGGQRWSGSLTTRSSSRRDLSVARPCLAATCTGSQRQRRAPRPRPSCCPRAVAGPDLRRLRLFTVRSGGHPETALRADPQSFASTFSFFLQTQDRTDFELGDIFGLRSVLVWGSQQNIRQEAAADRQERGV